VIDELTTHLDIEAKPVVCELLRELDKERIVVVDHDTTVQGHFDSVIDLQRVDMALTLSPAERIG
jgi:ABC-type lipoprotein export system ATPase subunit